MCSSSGIYVNTKYSKGFPGDSDGKEPACKAGDLVDPQVWKIPCRRSWQSTPVDSGLENPHGQRIRPWGCKELDMSKVLTQWEEPQSGYVRKNPGLTKYQECGF